MISLKTKEAEMLFALLAYELFGQKIKADVANINWESVLTYANEHAVTPLLYGGVQQIKGVPQHVFDSIERFAVRSTILSDRMAKSQNEILQCLGREKINAIILKGTSIAAYYPHPEVRMTGDIDILVLPEDLDKCGKILLQNGFVLEGSSDIHTNYRKHRVVIEVHHRVSSYPASAKGKYTERFMCEALKNTNTQRFAQYEFPGLNMPHLLVALLSHMERHMGASGIGLRQLCDWAVAINGVVVGNQALILETLHNCGLLRFAQILTGICEKYLGLPKCVWLDAAPDELVEETMADILSVGNFQAQYQKRPLASALIDPYDVEGDGKRRLIKTYFRQVAKKMRNEYSWATSSSWVPVFGVFYFGRWLLSLLKGEINVKGMLNTMLSSRTREKLLRKMCLYK